MTLFPAAKQIKEIINALNELLTGHADKISIADSDGNIAQLSDAINRTISSLQAQIAEQKRQNSQNQAIVNSMVEGVIAINAQKEIISINPAITRIFGVSKQDAEGKFFLEAIRNHEIFNVVDCVLAKKEFISKELTLLWPVQKNFTLSASPILENNTLRGCVLVIYDITEIRRLETIRSEFVANVSHELKTPLTAIKGFVETLLDGALENKEDSRKFLRIIREHTSRLNGLINDLLELSRIESKEITLIKKEIPLKKILIDVLDGYGLQLKTRGISLDNDIQDADTIYADEKRIKLVLSNLIDNAIKFNKESGSIKIGCTRTAAGIRVFFEDSGVGIPKESLTRVFERFYRVDRGRSRDLGGTGLGLSIVKHIIELHGGSVGAESTEDKGSKFYFVLPAV